VEQPAEPAVEGSGEPEDDADVAEEVDPLSGDEVMGELSSDEVVSADAAEFGRRL